MALIWPLFLALLPPCVASLIPSPSYAAPHVLDAAPVIHFTLTRRHGPINATVGVADVVVLPNLAHELEKAEARFALTKREFEGNKLVRKAKVARGYDGNGMLMGEVASEGIW